MYEDPCNEITPRAVIESIIGIIEAPIFAAWAFGQDFKVIHTSKMPDAWNKLHGDLLTVTNKGKLLDDIPKMIQIWKDQNNGLV